MSQKISEFFKFQPKIDSKMTTNFKIKAEKDEAFEIVIKTEPKEFQNSSKIDKTFKLTNIKSEFKHKDSKSLQTEDKNCKFCGKYFAIKNNLIKHQKMIHSKELNLPSCKICGRNFYKTSFLVKHMKIKHVDGKLIKFECDFDGRTFIDKNALKAHLKSHAASVKCDICQRFIKIGSINSHKTQFHGKDQKIQCEICLQTFKSIKRLQSHKLVHDKRIGCEICGKKYQSTRRLNEHKKKVHENLKRFGCEICGKKFNQKVHMQNHQKTHDKNRPKPLKCNRCDYSSDNKSHFAHHQKSHQRKDLKFKAMENPLKCSECPTFCRNKDSLWRHMNSVHPKVSFQCDLCARFVKIKYDFVKHINIHIKKLQKYC